MSVTGSGGSERKVEKSHLRMAPSEHVSLELLWLVPAPCLCWACWRGHSASAAAPGLEENTAPGKSRLLRTRPVQFPTAWQSLPAEPILLWEGLTMQQLLGRTMGLCSVGFSPEHPGHPAQPRRLHQASAQRPEGLGSKSFKIHFAASGNHVTLITSPTAFIFY